MFFSFIPCIIGLQEQPSCKKQAYTYSVRSFECLNDDKDEHVIAINNVVPAPGRADRMWF